MADDRIEVEIVLDDGSIKKGFTRLKKESKKAAKESGDDFDILVNKRLGSGIFQLKSQILAIGVAIGGLIAGFRLFANAVEASNVQADAINNLNTSLKLADEFSESASLSIQQFASDLQNVTRVGDETTLELFRIARTFSKTNAEAQKLTEAAIDLSAATGLTLDSAVRNLGKTFAGLTGELGEVLPDLRNLSADALKAGGALDFVADRFGGAAAQQAQTFSGRLDQLSNAWGDLLEGIGDFITRSPLANKLISDLSTIVAELAQKAKDFVSVEFGSGLEKARAESRRLKDEEKELNEELNRILKTGIKTQKQREAQAASTRRALALNAAEQEKVNNQLEKFTILQGKGKPDPGIDPAILKARAAAALEAEKLIVGFEASQIQAAENSLKLQEDSLLKRQQLIALQAEKERVFQEQRRIERQELANKLLEDERFTQKQRQDIILAFDKETQQKLKEQRDADEKERRAKLEEGFKLTGQQIAQGISSTVQSAVTAIAKGENAFEAFGKSLLSIVGDIAIQLGTFLIKTGLAIDSLKFALTSLTGGLAIAAGIGLVAIGALLKSAGGGAAAAASGQSTGPAGPEQFEQEIDTGDLTALNEQSKVNVNIQGDVLDSADTGLRIAEIINDSFDTNGTLIQAGAVG